MNNSKTIKFDGHTVVFISAVEGQKPDGTCCIVTVDGQSQYERHEDRKKVRAWHDGAQFAIDKFAAAYYIDLFLRWGIGTPESRMHRYETPFEKKERLEQERFANLSVEKQLLERCANLLREGRAYVRDGEMKNLAHEIDAYLKGEI